jgi:uncharacterized protein (DUF433 family)
MSTVADRNATSHIVMDEQGVPWIEGYNAKVIEVAQFVAISGWNTEQIHEQLPFIPLARIHEALAYYYDHKASLDADMELRHQIAEQMRRGAGESPTAAKLRAEGKLR